MTPIGGKPWVAVLGGTEHEYRTRHGAVQCLLHEIDHWVRWARFYDHAAQERLQGVRSEVYVAHGDHDWTFDIAGLPAKCGLRAPK